MTQKQGRTQKQRKQKSSNGNNKGSKKNPQTPLNLIMMNKGLAHQRRRR